MIQTTKLLAATISRIEKTVANHRGNEVSPGIQRIIVSRIASNKTHIRAAIASGIRNVCQELSLNSCPSLTIRCHFLRLRALQDLSIRG